ncbi:MAG TPA: AmmeMemoRadiSam system protein B [Tepidisphaeraceae bacterium]|nr:AmmeMemoRadiSam system protein B [Tepidisphaeraceae bacterium]
MAGPSAWMDVNFAGRVRHPAVAGMFYPADPAACQQAAKSFLRPAQAPVGIGQLSGAIVPHAGWVCSGAIAGQAIAAVASGRPDVEIVVVFGAVHTPAPLSVAVLDSHDAWLEPGATSPVAAELRRELAGSGRPFAVDDRFHAREHAVEVVLPLIQAAWPSARVLPVEVPAISEAMEIGRAAARRAIATGLRPIYLASSDLTHYGPNYQFMPAGVGPAAMQWTKDNDQRLLRIVTEMTPERVVPEVMERHNACGAGAIAAMMAACIEHGAKRAVVLRHATSFETLAAVAPQRPDNAVGYAAVVVGS